MSGYENEDLYGRKFVYISANGMGTRIDIQRAVNQIEFLGFNPSILLVEPDDYKSLAHASSYLPNRIEWSHGKFLGMDVLIHEGYSGAAYLIWKKQDTFPSTLKQQACSIREQYQTSYRSRYRRRRFLSPTAGTYDVRARSSGRSLRTATYQSSTMQTLMQPSSEGWE